MEEKGTEGEGVDPRGVPSAGEGSEGIYRVRAGESTAGA